jgi:hypothetical protein
MTVGREDVGQVCRVVLRPWWPTYPLEVAWGKGEECQCPNVVGCDDGEGGRPGAEWARSLGWPGSPG